METIFWLSVACILYVYVGYPMVLGLWAKALTRAHGPRPDVGRSFGWQRNGGLPGVTLIIAARDEAARLPERLANIYASDYPADRLQVIVASDGSQDGTAGVVARHAPQALLLRLPARGKAMALNAAVACARHPMLVFADARQRFAPDAIRRLASHFDDPAIGAVSGELLIEEGGSTIDDTVGAYWRYEKWLRRREAVVGSTLGVTGAIYAMRRELWQPLPPDTLLDDVLAPMRVVLGGHRVIFDERARAFDQAETDVRGELRRKIRTLAGNYQLLLLDPRLLVPVLNPVWFQFVSHKLGRLVVPYTLMTLFAASLSLAGQNVFYAVAFVAQAGFYGLAVYGALLDRQHQGLPLPMERS